IVDSNYGPGQLSLREALALTNTAQTGTSTISFAASLSNTTITLTAGELPVNSSLVIDGAGAPGLTVTGHLSSRALNINVPTTAASQNIDVRNIAFSNSSVTGSNNGGAVLVADEVATFTNVAFSGNKAGGTGGAVMLTSANSVTFDSCTFTNNSATGNGGAI